MSLLNVISVPTVTGIKTIEIHNADISKLKWNFDLLVISSYHNKYTPQPNTVIQSLQDNTGVIIKDLAMKPFLDFRESLNCWISHRINNLHFQYILCVEGIKSNIAYDGTSEGAMSNLFAVLSILQYKNVATSSIALPLLGTGYQKNSIEVILPILIEQAIKALNTNSNLDTIYFVEVDEGKAKLIDDTVNKYLKRSEETLEMVLEDPQIINVFDQILSKLIVVRDSNPKMTDNKAISDIIEKIVSKQLRFFELGILNRKLLELLLSEMSNLKSDKYISLFEYINDLKNSNIADWMITYLHTLRVFGNFVSHKDDTTEIPNHMEKADIVFFVHAMNRFLEFYLNCKGGVTYNRQPATLS